MPRQRCCHKTPCTCEMGNLYRFIEPIVLVVLAQAKSAHGYQIAQEAEHLAVTHAGVDVAAIYRVLRRLEDAGFVSSNWDTSRPGPARREYTITPSGLQHLQQWTTVLTEFQGSLGKLLELCQAQS